MSWTVALAGAELAAVLELGADAAGGTVPEVRRDALVLDLLVRSADAFRGDGRASSSCRSPATCASIAFVQERPTCSRSAAGW